MKKNELRWIITQEREEKDEQSYEIKQIMQTTSIMKTTSIHISCIEPRLAHKGEAAGL